MSRIQSFPDKSILLVRIVLWYTYNVAALNLATEGRDACVRYIYFVLNLYCGWYSLPLYLQMVRWRWGTATSLDLYVVKMQKESPRYSQYRGLSLVSDTYFVLCLLALYHTRFLFAIYSIYFFNVIVCCISKSTTFLENFSNLKHKKNPGKSRLSEVLIVFCIRLKLSFRELHIQ